MIKTAQTIRSQLQEELQDLGLWELLQSPDLTDLLVTEEAKVLSYTCHGVQDENIEVDPLALESFVATVATMHRLSVTSDDPILEATLPFGAIRLEAVLPPVTVAPILALRVPPRELLSLDQLVTSKSLPLRLASDLSRRYIDDRATMVVSGGVGTGKTTFAGALLDRLVRDRPMERLVILEDGARELRIEADNVSRLLTHEPSAVDMRRLLRTALRLNPDRIIVGEVRGAEALDFLKASNTGHPGGLLTIHANGPREALHRLDALVQEAGVPSQMDRILDSLDLLVHLRRKGHRRFVHQVSEIGADGHLEELYKLD